MSALWQEPASLRTEGVRTALAIETVSPHVLAPVKHMTLIRPTANAVNTKTNDVTSNSWDGWVTLTSNWFLMSVNSSCRYSSAWLTASSGVLLPSVCTCDAQE